jgi:hypothetical protein
MRSDQLKAIIDKYLAEHPEIWNEDMAGITYGALLPVCRARGFGPSAN